jgi:hypothetical protein
MEILDDKSLSDVISWLPHGRGFVIFRKKSFEQHILPKFFNKKSKYSSFTRKLNRWGFVRVTCGLETGAYYHPNFKRGGHRLCTQMSCRSNSKRPPSSKQAGPSANIPSFSLATPQNVPIVLHSDLCANMESMVAGRVAYEHILQRKLQERQILQQHQQDLLLRRALLSQPYQSLYSQTTGIPKSATSLFAQLAQPLQPGASSLSLSGLHGHSLDSLTLSERLNLLNQRGGL